MPLKIFQTLQLSKSCKRFVAIIEGFTNDQINTMLRLAQKYPPATRALLGAFIDRAKPAVKTTVLAKSLNPITQYKIGVGERFAGYSKMEYCMRLHENEKLFKPSIQFTAQHKGIKVIYVEKDYWVTFALHTIFKSTASEYAVFKGGTALSKCYGIIERFSEDIDLVVLNQGESGNKLKEKLRAPSKSIESMLPEIPVKEITNKLGMKILQRSTGCCK